MGLINNQNHMLEDWNLQSKGIYDFVFTSKSDPRSGYIAVMPSLYYSLWVYTTSDPPAGSPRLHHNEFLPNSSQTTNTEHSITASRWIFLFLALVFIARQVFRMPVVSNGQTKVWSTLQCRPLRQGERIRQTCNICSLLCAV